MDDIAREPAPPAILAPEPRWEAWACRAALVLLVVATFGRLLGYDYAQWDDGGTIFENPAYQSVRIDTFIDAWTRPHMSIFMPVTHTLWAAVAAAAGHATPGGHVVAVLPFRILSLVIHGGSTLLVFELLRRIVRALPAALAGAAIFAVHPIQVEAVAWISGEKDLLAGFFLAATLLAAMRGGRDVGRRVARWTFVALLLGTVAMLSKPQAMVAPLMVLALLRGTGVAWRRALTVSVPLLVPAVMVAVIARAVQPAGMVENVPLFLRPVVALDALGWYAAKLLVPVDFAIDYGHTPQVALRATETYLLAAGIALAMLAAWTVRRRYPLAAAGLALAAIAVLPVLGLTRFDFQYYSTVADHYVYAGIFGIALVAAVMFGWTLRRVGTLACATIACVVIAGLAVLSFRQAGVWSDTQTLFGHNLAINPHALGPGRVLAFAASQRGDDAAAVELLRVPLDVYPNDPEANYNLANALVRLGRPAEAIAPFERAIAREPVPAAFRHNYAILLIRLGRLDDAERQLVKAVESEPWAVEPRQSLEKLQRLRAAQPATQPTSP